METTTRTEKEIKEMLVLLAVLYRVDRTREKIGVLPNTQDQDFIEKTVTRMQVAGLLEQEPKAAHMRLTAKGKKILLDMIRIFDRTVQMNIFARVRIFDDLPEDLVDENGDVHGEKLDPRFGNPDEPTSENMVDIRLAMVHYLAENHPEKEQEVDPYLVVFLQKLTDGELAEENFWRRLSIGQVFRDIREIVDSAKTWRSMADDEGDARAIMQGLYQAGMLELQKREGDVCSACDANLALYADAIAEKDECPFCGRSFADKVVEIPQEDGFSDEEVVEETIIVEETTIWREYEDYGYRPVLYYDPYGYPDDMFLTGLFIGAVLF